MTYQSLFSIFKQNIFLIKIVANTALIKELLHQPALIPQNTSNLVYPYIMIKKQRKKTGLNPILPLLWYPSLTVIPISTLDLAHSPISSGMHT